MKILQLTNRLPYPLNDGGNIATYYVTYYLNEMGHKVHLLSLNTQKHYQDPAPLSSIAEVHTVDIEAKITIFGALKYLFARTPYNIQRFFSEQYVLKLKELLSENDYDIIQMEGVYLAIYLKYLRKWSSAKIVLRAHNIEHQIWERVAKNEQNIPRKIYLQWLSRQIRVFEQKHFDLFDAIIPISELDANFIRKYITDTPVNVITAGVEIKSFENKIFKENVKDICFLGSLEWLPNEEGVLWFIDKVWKKLKKKHPYLKFHIAGKNPPQSILKIKEDGVVVHGEVADAQEFISQFDIMIVPLLSGSGMRLKIIEALAHKMAVLTTPVGMEGIEVISGEHLMICKDENEYIEKTSTVLSSKNLREKLATKGFTLVSGRYKWENLIEKFELEYLKLT